MNFTDRAIVVVLGSTGAGKSKLAIEIAEEFDGEIISSDSMQVILLLYIFSHICGILSLKHFYTCFVNQSSSFN